MNPYRDPEEPEDPPTDAEVAFWDAVFVAAVRRGCEAEDALKWADWALAKRKDNFGTR